MTLALSCFVFWSDFFAIQAVCITAFLTAATKDMTTVECVMVQVIASSRVRHVKHLTCHLLVPEFSTSTKRIECDAMVPADKSTHTLTAR